MSAVEAPSLQDYVTGHEQMKSGLRSGDHHEQSTLKGSVGGGRANLQDSFGTFPLSIRGSDHKAQGTSSSTRSVKQSTSDVWGLDHKERRMTQEALEVGGAQHQAGKSPHERAGDVRSWKSGKEEVLK